MLSECKKQLKELSSLKQHAITVSEAQRDLERAKEDISNLETELSATGSAKTTDEVQIELDALSGDMYVCP